MSHFNHLGRPGKVGGSLPKNNLSRLFLILKGGSGSGNFGHAGRKGKRGGSATGGTSGNNISELVNTMSRGEIPYQDDYPGIKSFADKDGNFIKPFTYHSERIAKKAAAELSKETGVDQERLEEYLSGAGKANHVTSTSVLTQKTAAEVFGSKLSPYQEKKVEEFKGQPADLTPDEVKTVMIAVYNKTQKELKKLGIKELTVYRRSEQDESNALESWTLDPDTFKNTYSVHHSKPLKSKTIKAEDIYSLAGIGPGNFHNFEITIFGNK